MDKFKYENIHRLIQEFEDSRAEVAILRVWQTVAIIVLTLFCVVGLMFCGVTIREVGEFVEFLASAMGVSAYTLSVSMLAEIKADRVTENRNKLMAWLNQPEVLDEQVESGAIKDFLKELLRNDITYHE